MEQKKYPVYYAGQFLTHDNLNDSFMYLYEQDRLICRSSIGYGILKGLDYKYESDKGVLKIYPGTAITTDGYIIELKESAIVFKCLVKYESGMVASPDSDLLSESFLFYENDEQVNALGKESLSKTLWPKIEDYTIGIIIDLVEEKKVACNQKSCDVNNSKASVVYRPVLIKKMKLNTMNIFCDPLRVIQTKRLLKIIESRDLNLFSEKVMNIFKENKDIIFTELNYWNSSSNDKISLLKELIEKSKNEFSTSVNTLDSLAKNVSKKSEMTEIPSFYLLFLEDLKTAMNEFVSFYNYYIHTYQLFTSNNQKERLIILGSYKATQTNDTYRNNFRYTIPNPQQTNDHSTLTNLFIRIPKIIKLFKQNEAINTDDTIDKVDKVDKVKLVPSCDYAVKLEEQSIPYYYNHEEISKFWWAFNPFIKQDKFHYQNFKVQDYAFNFDKYPLFRLEGYYNMNVGIVYKYLKDLIEANDLPVKVVKLELKKPRYLGKEYHRVLDDFFNRNTFYSFDDKAKKGNEANKEIENQKGIKAQLEKVANYVKISDYNLDNQRFEILPSQIVKTHGILKDINDKDTVFTEYIKALYKDKTLPKEVTYKYFRPIAAFNLFCSIINEMCIKNYKMAEYLGGVYKNSTLVLLYYNGKVIMDICMPGFVEVEENL